jgi:CheY-like chemotaxis protein/signal transduction histidine kinase
MFPSLRSKLFLIVTTATMAVALVLATGALMGARFSRDLNDVEARLVPKVELGPRLEAEFERMRQAIQDAVAAQDPAALDATLAQRTKLFDLIGSAGTVLTPADAAALRWAIQDYYEASRDISRRLIAGETGETLVDDMNQLAARHKKASDLIKQTTRLEENELSAAFAGLRATNARAHQLRVGIGLMSVLLVVALSYWISRAVLRHVGHLSEGFARFATGDFATEIPIAATDELGNVASKANQMAASLKRLAEQRDKDDWIKSAQTDLSGELRGELALDVVAERALGFLASRLDARAAVLYMCDDEGVLELAAQHGLVDSEAGGPTAIFKTGVGLVGQAAKQERIVAIDDTPEHYFKICSGLGEASPRQLVLLPLWHLGKPLGVLEFALFTPASERGRELLNAVRPILVSALGEARSRAELQDLLQQTQRFAARLAVQEEELRENNQELQTQQRELRRANDELETQRQTLVVANEELLEARERVQQKADELAKVSAYKSQFLANMSHELRTPLNSMLLLSQLLADNLGANLTPKQIEHARTIHGAGQDLLALINQVLDLAKIEAGRQDVHLQSVELERFLAFARRVFEPLAQDKGLELALVLAQDLPNRLVTDEQRLERILVNLLGNAIKFTERGSVTLRIGRPEPGVRFERSELRAESTIAFSVTDTGIGIAAEAQERVFAPFEQLESDVSRRYAGTGLGLAIARESARLLGGELRVQSHPGVGSTFTCYLPERAHADEGEPLAEDVAQRVQRAPAAAVADDRGTLNAREPHLLVIEDDPVLAEQLVEIIHSRKLKVVVANTGREGLLHANERQPHGIILDVKLPDIDGWTLMERLQQAPATRSIPVHFISGVDAPARGLSLGAIGYLTKPATHAELVRAVRALAPGPAGTSGRVLVVEDDASNGQSVLEILTKENVEGHHVTSANAALKALESEDFGCIILDLGLPDMDGLRLLETLQSNAKLPRVVVHTGRALTKKETRQLEAYAEAVILKDGDSAERLLEEIRLFVRHLKENLAQDQEPVSAGRRASEISLEGVKILLAEDDMRTVYALCALLRSKGADVVVAENGREALELLAATPDVKGVLMDIMMPEMDGYEAMRRLRQDARFSGLPVIALTARAMKGERERCLEAGANEYLTKPVDGDRLLLAMQSWRGKSGSNGAGRRN